MNAVALRECIEASDDAGFDRIYPPAIRGISAKHWTPVSVARRAARFLVRSPGTRVLDIGCGPGKFCLVGALTTTGRFTGIEQRAHLCEAGRKRVARAGIRNVELLHGNMAGIDFSAFGAFYLFNPFAEHAGEAPAVDDSIPLSRESHATYIHLVSERLAAAPAGTRVATYFGACDEIPSGYQCLETAADANLRLWEKA